MKKQLLLTRMLLLVALLVGSISSVWAENYSTTYNYSDLSGMFGTGSSKEDASTYWKVPASDGNSATISIPITYQPTSNITITFNIATFGSGDNPSSSNTTITAVGTETGSNWSGSTVSIYPSSKTYVNGVMTITKPDSPTTLGGLTVTMGVNSGVKIFRLQSITISYTYTASSDPSSAASFTNETPSFDLKDASSFTQTATTADGYIGTDGASITYSITANTAGASINESTGEVTPTKAGYVTVQASAAAIAGKYSASSATYTLTVTDNRVFTVTCHTGDDSKDIDRNSGATLNLDNPDNKYGMSFVGWSSTNNIANPTWVANTTIVTGDMELYAMYEAVAGEYSYHLVEADQSDWRGDYLIAYSSDTFANGKSSGTTGIGSAETVENPSSHLVGKIVDSTWGDEYYVSLVAIDDDDLTKGYVLKTQDDYYNYHTNNTGNGINGTSKNKATAASYPITVNYVSSSEINITLDKGQVFRYNTSEEYFRYYKSSSYSNMGEVYLYKRTEDVAPVYSLGTSLGTEEKVTIGSSKYASYCSDNALDFSETDVKAYKAKVDEDKVVLTQVDYVPANTGVILYCATANDYDVPVISNAAAVSDNEMVGVTVETTVVWNPSTDVYNYILQQGVFNKAAEAGAKLRANRAYLSTTYNVTAPGAKPLTIVFNDNEQSEETDGIKAVSTAVENGVRYNLAGQRVGNDYKGIVIVNGKKYLRK